MSDEARAEKYAPADVEVERYELTAAARYRFEVERRDFMRIFATLGGGLLVMASSPRIDAQESGRGGQNRTAPRDVSAWLHIDEKGQVTAYTGKTEIGQNIRTSLTQAIAEELRVASCRGDDGDGGYGPGAVRRGHIRIAVDTTHGAAAGPRRVQRARDADRPRCRRMADRSAGTFRERWLRRRRPGSEDRVWRTDERAEADRGNCCRNQRQGSVRLDRSRRRTEEDQWPRFRHGPSCLHTGHHTSGNAIRSRAQTGWLRWNTRVSRRHRCESDGRRHDCPGRRLSRRRRGERAWGTPRRFRHSRRVASAHRSSVFDNDLRSSQKDCAIRIRTQRTDRHR